MAALASLRQQCEPGFDIIPLFDHTKGAFGIDHIPAREDIQGSTESLRRIAVKRV